MRALLLYNPAATTTTARVRDAIAQLLASELKLEVAPTKRRDHASFLAAGAADEGIDVVVALGGDGTVNEIVQGVAHSRVLLAVLPGGSTNVYARALGLPNDPRAATQEVVDLLRHGQHRRVPLASANERYFCFAAGLGFDAEVVRRVEQRPRVKRVVRQGAFVISGIGPLLTASDPRRAEIRVTADGTTHEGYRSVVCGAAQPYTYLGPWPVRLCPDGSLDRGLAVTALTRLGLPGLLRLARVALSAGDVRRLPTVDAWSDLTEAHLLSDRPLPLQLDGDYVGELTEVWLRRVPAALSVVAPRS
ncbi:diacylglycerol/lipid kinase family protein [Egibacter rhizosphaerae]|uniref:diacylglycerol/lipid kinase family protein n=1 Tax=Egibacter rhizosphaerae TaxID=1670831 RepID=UPI0013F1575F|nr:diacylglycerol kinase family protein [Egibacter rhizosphaerae]